MYIPCGVIGIVGEVSTLLRESKTQSKSPTTENLHFAINILPEQFPGHASFL
jgi:hypothetical protein